MFGSIVKIPLGGGTNLTKTRYQVLSSGWSATPNSSGLYTNSITLNPVLKETYPPEVMIAGSTDDTFATDTEKEQFYMLSDQCALDDPQTLILYATEKPTDNFYIYVGGETPGGGSIVDIEERLNDVESVIPSTASTSNKLATEDDIPGVATDQTAGIVKPDGTTITVDANGTISAVNVPEPSPILCKNRYTISANNWSNSPDASGYYTYTLTLTTELNATYSPNIYVSGSGDNVYPSATDKTMFSLIKRANLSTGTTLVLYAETIPTSDFYIYVEGEMKDASATSGSIDKSSYTVSSSNWSNSTDAEGYYSYSLTLSTALKTSYSPNITISGSSGTEYPTSTQTAMYDLLSRANLSTTTTLMLYAKTKPTDTFYINVQGEAA